MRRTDAPNQEHESTRGSREGVQANRLSARDRGTARVVAVLDSHPPTTGGREYRAQDSSLTLGEPILTEQGREKLAWHRSWQVSLDRRQARKRAEVERARRKVRLRRQRLALAPLTLVGVVFLIHWLSYALPYYHLTQAIIGGALVLPAVITWNYDLRGGQHGRND